ncbi:MAG: TIGR03757 family integrating conjugative element protein [Gammaproteobacteria bacterium]|nr:TIGR03757 family integrating conjugative element protein [Gammaproteobacteria bacterium]
MNAWAFRHLVGYLIAQPAWIAMALLFVLCMEARAGELDEPVIEAFVAGDVRVPGKTEGATVYVIDGIHRLQARLSRDLPGDPQVAREIVLKRFAQMETAQGLRLENAARGLARAMHYGIDRYPAVVFDGQAVVYGVPDIDAARWIWRRWKKAQASQ